MLSLHARRLQIVGRCPITRLPITRAMAQRDLALVEALLARLAGTGIEPGPLERRRRELREMVRRG